MTSTSRQEAPGQEALAAIKDRQHIAAVLRASELDYFRSGAQVIQCGCGEIIHTAGFETLAAGVVLHDVAADSLDGDLAAWLTELENDFDRLGAANYRLYVTSEKSYDRSFLTSRGYREEREIGMSVEISHSTERPAVFERSGALGWQNIDQPARQAARKSLYRAAGTGPDGHAMHDGQFADYEQTKQDAGYMASYLLYHKQLPIACVSLAVKRRFGRLKNLLVHPQHQGLGYGRILVDMIKFEAAAQGAEHLGTYAVQGKPAYLVYRDAGMREVTSQIEYCKAAR